MLEEAGIDALYEQAGAPTSLFSAVTARGISAIGSTFPRSSRTRKRLAPES